jgi:hypothetical protein
MNQLNVYKTLASQSICQATVVYDHARAAEKLLDPNLVGGAHKEWSEGPYLSVPSGCKELSHEHPYILRVSVETQAAINISFTGSPEFSHKSETGSIQAPLPQRSGSRVNPFIAKPVIIEQFELLKDYLVSINAPINKKQAKKYYGVVDQVYLDTLVDLATRRNELTHELNAAPPNLKESVEYYYSCVWIAEAFNQISVSGAFENNG